MYSNRPAMDYNMSLAEIIKEEIKKEIVDELRARQNYYFTPEIYRADTDRTGGKWVGGPDQPELIKDLPVDAGAPCIGNGGPYVNSIDDILCGTSPEWGNARTESRGKGILYGIGTVALLGILIPSFGNKVQTVLTRTASEGVELIEKARSIAARTKEDIEDLIAEADLKKLMKKPRR